MKRRKLLLELLMLVILMGIILLVFSPLRQGTKAESNIEPAKSWNVVYVVRAGDTLSRIADELGTTVDDVVKLNNIRNPNIIHKGQELKVNAYNNLTAVNVSWYGPGFDGRPMANGKIFHMSDPTVVAHKYLPFGTRVKLTYNSKSIIVVVQDRGPFQYVNGKRMYEGRRDFDLSEAVAKMLGIKRLGVVKCKVEIIGG